MAKSDRPPKPSARFDELIASTDFRELFRYQRGDTVQIYNLRPLSNGKAELWIVTSTAGKSTGPGSVLGATLKTVDEAIKYLDTKEQELRKDGWKKLPD